MRILRERAPYRDSDSTPPMERHGAEEEGEEGSVVGPRDVAAAVQTEEQGEDGDHERNGAEEVDPLPTPRSRIVLARLTTPHRVSIVPHRLPHR